MSDDELKVELSQITTELYRAGLVTAMGGNISVRSSTQPDCSWITPSQIFKGHLKPEQMIMIDREGKKIRGDGNPSMESVYHAGVMKSRPDINAVVHTHAPLSTIFGMCDLEVLPVSTEAVYCMSMPVIPFYPGGSTELAQAVIEQVGQTKAIGAFLRNHGLITVGKSLREAADNSYMVEHVVDILLKIKMAGLSPSQIPEEMIKYIIQSGGALY
ncbi:MAG TPA: class II aldolase/adducin family protein [Anaerolineales bacterium]